MVTRILFLVEAPLSLPWRLPKQQVGLSNIGTYRNSWNYEPRAPRLCDWMAILNSLSCKQFSENIPVLENLNQLKSTAGDSYSWA